ncbi:MAG: transglycosylase SLT domain-containing protein [Hydrogenophaga sp.]|jgi:soluble lytic murein transglycosylase-like protein|nr:transglycosylase SLT domain-containing protein [Hydrogenophaga sp.]
MTPALLRPLLMTTALVAMAWPAAAAPSDTQRQQAAAWREEARAHEHGEGVPRNADRAVSLYCKAALAGDTLARYNLGWIYANGRGMERNDAYAAYFFKLAADQGDGPAQRMLQSVGPDVVKPPCVAELETAAVAGRRAVQLANATPGLEPVALVNPALLATNAQQRKIMEIVQRVAPEYGIHPNLAYAIIRAESNFNPQAVSPKNAQGLMQLIPETAARFNVRKPFDPEQNIRGGLSYLRWLMAYFKGQVPLVAAAYNAGEGNVERYRGVPPFPETQGYIRRIQEVFHLQQHPYDEAVTKPTAHWLRIVENKRP